MKINFLLVMHLVIHIFFCGSIARAQEKVTTSLGPTTTCLTESDWKNIPAHPRLFANSARWKQLTKQVKADPVSKQLFSIIYERAEVTLSLPSLGLKEKGIHQHGPNRQIQGRIAALAMCYRLTGEARFLTRARLEMNELATNTDWRPGHFLSTSEATVAMSIGLDWLYNDLSVEERTLFSNAIIEKGLKASLVDSFSRNWLNSTGNWGPVCHGGMALGAITVAEQAPALAMKIVNRSINNVRYAAASFAPAGAYSEGPGYWAYCTTFYVMLQDALNTVFGQTCNLEMAPGFMQTADYIIQLMTPSDAMFNFADSESNFGFEPVLFWFSNKLNRKDIAEPLLRRLAPMRNSLVSDRQKPDASRLQPLGLLWWKSSLEKSASVNKAALSWWSEGGPIPQAVLRSAWNDPGATYVGIKAGKAAGGHGHMDVGSFILEAKGVRWAEDLGRDFYDLPRLNGLGADLFNESQSSKRWSIFADGPESHNIIRFNNAVQIVDGKAEIRPATNKQVLPAYLIDLTPVYADQVVKVTRGISLRSDQSVLIRDEWQTGNRGQAVTFQWLTYANVEIRDSSIMLTKNGEQLMLKVLSPSSAHIAVQDMSAAQNVWDYPKPGLKRITIRVGTAPNSEGHFALIASPNAEKVRIEKLVPLIEW